MASGRVSQPDVVRLSIGIQFALSSWSHWYGAAQNELNADGEVNGQQCDTRAVRQLQQKIGDGCTK